MRVADLDKITSNLIVNQLMQETVRSCVLELVEFKGAPAKSHMSNQYGSSAAPLVRAGSSFYQKNVNRPGPVELSGRVICTCRQPFVFIQFPVGKNGYAAFSDMKYVL